MKDLLEMAGGLAAGALTGLVVGCVMKWSILSAAYTGLNTCWQDCGPFIFVPLWIGAVIGLVSMLERGTITGLLLTAASGGVAGFLAATVFYYIFGKHFRFYFANLIHGLCGVVAAFIWNFLQNRFFHQ